MYLFACCSFLFLCLTLDTQSQTATLAPGQTYNGTLSSSDSTIDGGQHLQCFNLNVQSHQEIVVTLRSRQFDTTLAAGTGRCGSGDVDLTMLNDDFETNSTDSQLRFTTTQQNYVLAVTSYGAGETGSYTLTIEGPAGNTSGEDTPYHVGTISGGQQYSGTLTSNSLVLDDGQYVQCVDLNLQVNQQVTVTLRSRQFDTQLFIGAGRCLGDFDLTMVNDDFETGSTDSQLQFLPSQNQYIAIISSYGAGETGSYTLNAASGTGSQTTTASDDNDDESSVGADYLLYGVIPNQMPEGMIFGTASGRQQTTEHTIQLTETQSMFMVLAMCDFVNCQQISLTVIKPDGSEIHGNAITENSLSAVDIVSAEDLPAGNYRIRVSVPDCTGSCRYTLNGIF